MKIIGLAIRTNNVKAQTELSQLWGKFYSENILEQIPNRISNAIFSVYTDYESNYTGDYTCILGAQVSSLEEIPEGMIGRNFEAENFKNFLVKGEMPQAVAQTWKEIWKQDATLKRKYTYDYEVYSQESVEIFVAVH